MKPEEIIELAKKAKLKANRYPAINEIERLLALHREALIASGELVPKEQVEADKRDAERYRKARGRNFGIANWTQFAKPMISYEASADEAIDRARSQP